MRTDIVIDSSSPVQADVCSCCPSEWCQNSQWQLENCYNISIGSTRRLTIGSFGLTCRISVCSGVATIKKQKYRTLDQIRYFSWYMPFVVFCRSSNFFIRLQMEPWPWLLMISVPIGQTFLASWLYGTSMMTDVGQGERMQAVFASIMAAAGFEK